MNDYRLVIRLISDTCFARGSETRGWVNTEIDFDELTGLPLIRGRRIKGLLVESAREALFPMLPTTTAGSSIPAEVAKAARFLFGRGGVHDDTDARMWVATARVDSAVEEVIRRSVELGEITREEVVDAFCCVRRQTAIDAPCGVAKRGSLRALRAVVRETTFYAPVHFRSDPAPVVLPLLAACAAGVRRGGLARNRGLGRLAVDLEERHSEADNYHSVMDPLLATFEEELIPKPRP